MILAVLGLITAVVLLAMTSSGWLRQDRSGRSGIRTTQTTNPDATLIYYTLLERLGYSVERNKRIFTAESHREAAMIFMIDPIVPIGAGEITELSDWLVQGGILIATSVPQGLSPALNRMPNASLRYRRFAQSRTKAGRSRGARDREVPGDRRDWPLACDVSTVALVDNDVFGEDVLDPNVASPPVCLFADDQGVRIIEHRLGRGRVIVLADSSFLANGRIVQADNNMLAVNLAAYALAQSECDTIVFDEYHFGYGSGHGGFNILGGMLLTTSAGWAVLSLTVAGILFLLYKGRQFGPRRGLAKERRRSKSEYVGAVGATFRAAGAHRLTLDLIGSWFRQRLASAVALSPNVSNDALADVLAQRRGVDRSQCHRALEECDRLLARPKISERQLRAAVAQLAEIEKEIGNGSGNGT